MLGPLTGVQEPGGALPHALPRAGCYSLSVRDGDTLQGGSVKHYKIRTLDSGGFYISPRSSFDTLQELVEHYKGEPWGCCSSTTLPGTAGLRAAARLLLAVPQQRVAVPKIPAELRIARPRGCAMSQAVVLVSDTGSCPTPMGVVVGSALWSTKPG